MELINQLKKRSLRETLYLIQFHFKIIFKYKMLYFLELIKNRFKTKKILFYPDVPCDRHVIYKILNSLGYKITNNLNDNFKFAFDWKDVTFKNPSKELSNLKKVYNFNCKDISKDNVGGIFKKIFGYNLSVNPLKYKGKCVVKPNKNATGTGKIVSCPLRKKENFFAYQKMIDSTNESGLLVNIRVPIFHDEIPFVYFRFKSQDEKLFDTVSKGVKIMETKEVFSFKEIKNILSFCAKLGMDYGELDILRDKKDKKIYIVDANTTPFGPHGLPKKITQEAIRKLADCFENNFF